ncbi:unnamed protein product [Sympodiomycopsis kandeliae]
MPIAKSDSRYHDYEYDSAFQDHDREFYQEDDEDEDDFDLDPSTRLLSKENNSIPLKVMYQTPTLKRSFSSKRISRRESDSSDEGEPEEQRAPQSPAEGAGPSAAGPSTPSRRLGASRSFSRTSLRASSFRSPRAPSRLGQAQDEEGNPRTPASADAEDEEDRPNWLLSFDEDRTATENKSLAVSAELDAMGMGRYQWCIFFLCGFGFFIDLLWAQMFGLITVPLRNENGFGASKENIGTLSTAFNVGLTVGAFMWGIGVDVLGRKWSFYLTCLIAGVFGIASGAPPTFTGLRVLVAFVGSAVGGNIPADCTITLEFLPTNRRFLLALLSIFQPMGTLVSSGIAYAFIPKYSCAGGRGELNAAEKAACTREKNTGWRYALYTIGAITLFIFFLRFFVFKFQESPAYLINKGHDEEAIRVLNAIAKKNKAPKPQLTMEDFILIEDHCSQVRSRKRALSDATSVTDSDEISKPVTNVSSDRSDPFVSRQERRAQAAEKQEALANETSWQTFKRTLKESGSQLTGVKLLFRDRTMGRITILLWLTYMADFFGFNIAGVFLPLILSDNNAAQNIPLSETYRDYVAIYAPGIAACLLACGLIEIPRLGRQWVMILSSALMAVSFFLYTIVDTQAASVGLNAMEYFMQSVFNAVLYAATPEFYPSKVRGTASGLTSTLGRIAGIIAPIAGQSLYGANGGTPEGAARTLYLGGGVTLLCPLALMLLPYDTRGKKSY